jgi:hypothetical protein
VAGQVTDEGCGSLERAGIASRCAQRSEYSCSGAQPRSAAEHARKARADPLLAPREAWPNPKVSDTERRDPARQSDACAARSPCREFSRRHPGYAAVLDPGPPTALIVAIAVIGPDLLASARIRRRCVKTGFVRSIVAPATAA